MGFDFKGKRVLVTGAGRGIGKALALALADTGCDVYALSRQQTNLDTLVALNPNIHPIQVDLSDWDATRKALEDLEPLDGLVNNAVVRIQNRSSALTMPKEAIDKVMAVNLYGAINVTQVIAAKMVEAGKGGSIVNVSSVAGLRPAPNRLAYCTSKAALDMMTKQFALELGPSKIRVNSANLAPTYTDSVKAFFDDPEKSAEMMARTPLGQFAKVSDTLGPIMYLLSDHSSMVTGTLHIVDGGLITINSV